MDGTGEIELKLEIDPDDLDRLAAAPPFVDAKATTGALTSVYFDTADRRLRAAGLSLRVRHDGARRVQTVKAGEGAVGLSVRDEWEREITGDAPHLDDMAGPLTGALAGEVPSRLFRTQVSRTVRLIERDDARIECVVDFGHVVADTGEVPLCEVELELKAGPLGALFDLARAIDAAVPVRLGVLSKSERGYRLADGRGSRAQKAPSLVLARDMSASAAFQAIVRACLAQFRLNEALLAEDDDSAALHQARVGLRRLRSALSLFKPLLAADPVLDGLRERLRSLAGALGQARDLDVLIEGVADPDARLTSARADAYAEVRAMLASAATRRLMLDLVEWLVLGAWLVTPADPDSRDRPAAETAAAILERHRKRLKRDGKHLATIDDAARHEVRIEAKKLRYATEFFATLFSKTGARKRHARFLKALTALQEELGTLNDEATAPALMARFGLDTPAAPGEARARHLAAAGKAFARLMKADRFWD